MEVLSSALSIMQQINRDKFCRAFQKLFDISFHTYDLQFWCDLTGIRKKVAWKTLRKQGWKRFGRTIFIRGKIETVEELTKIFGSYGLQKKDIINEIIYIVERNNGCLQEALKHLPISYDVLHILLDLQDVLIPVTYMNWLPKSNLPDQLKGLSRYAHFQRSNWDEQIIATFERVGKPLRLEELIYQSTGIVPAPATFKRIFYFMLNILPVSKISETEYWILTKWEPHVDLNLIDSITSILSEHDALSSDKIVKLLPKYEENKTRKALDFWPEFAKCSDNSYKLNISPLDDELLAIMVPFLLKPLSEAENGLAIQELFKHVETITNSHGLKIHSRDFKSFLKCWGEAAIVGTRVFAMKKAPFQKMRLGDVAYLILKENDSPMPYAELEAQIRKRRNYIHPISSVFLSEPKLSRPSRGYWALREWGMIEYDPQIHNRIGEVLISIIEEAARPVHKSEIRRQLRRRGMNMNDTTLQLDITENEQISQVARGVYSLSKWNLTFRDLFRFKFPFRLSVPDGNPTVYEMEDGFLIEYFVTKLCLELGRILVKRYITEYLPGLEQYTKYTVKDFANAEYEGWVDQVDEGRYQFLGLGRWYKTHKPRYGENIYLFIPIDRKYSFSLLTAEQADVWMDRGAEINQIL